MKISEKTLHMIDDLIRVLRFEANTSDCVILQIKSADFDMEMFARKREIYLNEKKIGEITEEIMPFV